MKQPELQGVALSELISQPDFIKTMYLAWTGKQPTDEQETLFSACLVALIDHGPEALSTKTTRMAASGGAEFHAAMSAGLLAAGKYHGSMPLQQAGELFENAIKQQTPAEKIVQNALENRERLPGFGHRLYDEDPRAQALKALAEEDDSVKLAFEIEEQLEQQKGKKLCLNVDGMIGALLPQLGISTEIAPALFLVARSVGMAMHVRDEYEEKPARMREV